MSILGSIFGESPKGPDLEAINEMLAQWFNTGARDIMRDTRRQGRIRNRQVNQYMRAALQSMRGAYQELQGSQQGALMENERRRQETQGGVLSSLVGSGFANSTILPTMQSGVNRDFSESAANINANYASRLAQARTGIAQTQQNMANVRAQQQYQPNLGAQLTLMRKLARQGVFTGVREEGKAGFLGEFGGILGPLLGGIGMAAGGPFGALLGGLGGMAGSSGYGQIGGLGSLFGGLFGQGGYFGGNAMGGGGSLFGGGLQDSGYPRGPAWGGY